MINQVHTFCHDHESKVTMTTLTSSSFYGDSRSELPSSSSILPATEPALPPYLSDPLLGPSRVWKIFRKQIDALECIASLRLEGELLPFSYESTNWERLFLVANPDIFWFRDSKKPLGSRHTYEIIAENRVSKLYFDLEYDKGIPANRDCDGNEMTKTFIRVVLYYIHKLFGVKFKMSQVLVLDSTTSTKFSVHLVFQIPLVFRTNIHAGHFVRFVANELINIDTICTDEEQLRYDIFKETTINVYSIKDLFVTNGKAARVLFCDLAVYTRNRLFRIYKSSKQNKNTPLLVSEINKWKPDNVAESDTVQYDRFIFLHSLITYFLTKPDENMVKEFEKPALNPNYSSETNLRKLEKLHSGQISPTKLSPYSDLDKYILTRVRPHGQIYRNVHFPSTNITVYDIKGFRYCGNIGRWHKSQNIKLIADVNRGVYYQKCHDSECADYKSPEWPIPPEVWFKIRPPDEEDLMLENGLDELEGILNGETPCIQESSGTPCIEITSNNETSIEKSSNNGSPCIEKSPNKEKSCIQTSSNNCTPCINKSGIDEAPCIEKSGNNEAPCIQTSSNNEPPCIEKSPHKETLCIPSTNNSTDCDKRLSKSQEQNKIEPPCILETDISETPCILQTDTSEPPCILHNVSSETPCILQKDTSELPCIESYKSENELKRPTLKRSSDSEISCIEHRSEPPCIERNNKIKDQSSAERKPKRPCIQKL